MLPVPLRRLNNSKRGRGNIWMPTVCQALCWVLYYYLLYAENLSSIGTIMTLVSQKMKRRLSGHLPCLIIGGAGSHWQPESRARAPCLSIEPLWAHGVLTILWRGLRVWESTVGIMNLQAWRETIFSGISSTCRVLILCKILCLKCYLEIPRSVRCVLLLRSWQSGFGCHHTGGRGHLRSGKVSRVDVVC